MGMITPDELHRLVKLAMDTGEATSFEEAQNIFAGYCMGAAVGPEIAWSWSHQVALLTFLELASRVFLGGVYVTLPSDVQIPNVIAGGVNLHQTMERLGVHRVESLETSIPAVAIGTATTPQGADFGIRAIFSGWRAGIIPSAETPPFEFESEFPVSAILAAALAVNEAFLYLRKDTPEAGLREAGLSLWRPDVIDTWSAAENDGPALHYLPNRLWMLGLGHLGQAYLWVLSMLPYACPDDVSLALQDIDVITASGRSTGVLTRAGMVGSRKTRAMAAVLESRGFKTALNERRFDETLRLSPDDPPIALCGFDNAIGRQPLCEVGFKFVVEAGLGSGAKDFRGIRIHTFPGTRNPRDLWKIDQRAAIPADAPAYNDLKARGLDQCGVTMLAGKAVGAPFVGMAAATLSVAEILRLLHDGPLYALHDLDLKSPGARLSSPRATGVPLVNPGFSPSLSLSIKR